MLFPPGDTLVIQGNGCTGANLPTRNRKQRRFFSRPKGFAAALCKPSGPYVRNIFRVKTNAGYSLEDCQRFSGVLPYWQKGTCFSPLLVSHGAVTVTVKGFE